MPAFTSASCHTFGKIIASHCSSCKTLSDLHQRSSTQDAHCANYVRLPINDVVGRMRGSLDFTTTSPLCAFVHNGKIVTLSCLSTDNAYIIGSLGEDTDRCCPAKIPINQHAGTIVTIISQADADATGFPVLDVLPMNCTNKSAPTDPDESSDDPAPTEHTAASLNWTITSEADRPRFVVMPNFCPLPAGFRVIPNISLTGLNAWDHDTPLHFTVWTKGIRYLHANCDGYSCHSADNPLFYTTGVVLPTNAFNLRDRIDVSLSGIDAIGEPDRFHQAHDTHQRRVTKYKLHKAQSSPVDPSELEHHSTTGNKTTTGETLSTITADSDNSNLDTNPIVLQYRILLAHERHNSNGTTTLVLPPAGEVLRKIIESSSPSDAANSVQPNVRNHIYATHATENLIDLRVTMRPELFDAAFCGAIRLMKWLRDPINASTSRLGFAISLLTFGTVRVDSESYLQRMLQAQQADSEERVGIDRRAAAKPNSKLYYMADLSNAERLQELFANLYLFMRCADGTLEDSIQAGGPRDKPAILTIIFQPILRQLAESAGRDWARIMSVHPSIWCNLLSELHASMLNAFRVADDITYRKDALAHGEIQGDAFGQIKAMAQITQVKLVAVILHSNANDFNAPSPLYLTLNPAEVTKRAGDSNGGNSAKRGRTNTSNNNNTNDAATNSGSTGRASATAGTGTSTTSTAGGSTQRPGLTPEERKKKGLFKYDGTGRIPTCDVLFPHHKKSGELAYMCKDFCFVGKYCRRPECQYAHIFRKDNIAADKLTQVEQYLTATEGVSWNSNASGRAAAGSTPAATGAATPATGSE